MNKTIIASLFFMIGTSCHSFAQSVIDTAMHSSGKIYLVIGVLVSIFIGIIIYMISLDNKLTKIENQIKENE